MRPVQSIGEEVSASDRFISEFLESKNASSFIEIGAHTIRHFALFVDPLLLQSFLLFIMHAPLPDYEYKFLESEFLRLV